jgi:hypothetical protein
MHPTDSPAHGGAATPDRQCQFTKSTGFRCEDWALRGHEHCFRHHQYLSSRPENPIDVPLLEDEDSLLSLLSQTLRALACGTIAPANGRAILAGCRIMQGILTRRLAQAKFQVKLTRLGSPAAANAAADALFGPKPPDQPPAEFPEQFKAEPQAVQRTAESTRYARQQSKPAPAPPSTPDPRSPHLTKSHQGLTPSDEQMRQIRLAGRAQASNPFVSPQGVPANFTVEDLVAMQALQSGPRAHLPLR